MRVRKFRLVGVLMERKEVVGYRVYDETRFIVSDLTIPQMIMFMKNYEFTNVKVEKNNLVCTDGSYYRLPIINATTGMVLKNNLLFVLYSFEQYKDTYYRIIDCGGAVLEIKESQVIKLHDDIGFHNIKVVKRNGKRYVSAIRGTIPKVKKEGVVTGLGAMLNDLNNKRSLFYDKFLPTKLNDLGLMGVDYPKDDKFTQRSINNVLTKRGRDYKFRVCDNEFEELNIILTVTDKRIPLDPLGHYETELDEDYTSADKISITLTIDGLLTEVFFFDCDQLTFDLSRKGFIEQFYEAIALYIRRVLQVTRLLTVPVEYKEDMNKELQVIDEQIRNHGVCNYLLRGRNKEKWHLLLKDDSYEQRLKEKSKSAK